MGRGRGCHAVARGMTVKSAGVELLLASRLFKASSLSLASPLPCDLRSPHLLDHTSLGLDSPPRLRLHKGNGTFDHRSDLHLT
jgi:hypothetical protein